MTTEVEKEYLRKFDEYIYNWTLLDRVQIPLIWQIIFPVKFYLEMRILHKKAKLTNEYQIFIHKAKEIMQEQYIKENNTIDK